MTGRNTQPRDLRQPVHAPVDAADDGPLVGHEVRARGGERQQGLGLAPLLPARNEHAVAAVHERRGVQQHVPGGRQIQPEHRDEQRDRRDLALAHDLARLAEPREVDPRAAPLGVEQREALLVEGRVVQPEHLQEARRSHPVDEPHDQVRLAGGRGLRSAELAGDVVDDVLRGVVQPQRDQAVNVVVDDGNTAGRSPAHRRTVSICIGRTLPPCSWRFLRTDRRRRRGRLSQGSTVFRRSWKARWAIS
jgi:hypothetical protein